MIETLNAEMLIRLEAALAVWTEARAAVTQADLNARVNVQLGADPVDAMRDLLESIAAALNAWGGVAGLIAGHVTSEVMRGWLTRRAELIEAQGRIGEEVELTLIGQQFEPEFAALA